MRFGYLVIWNVAIVGSYKVDMLTLDIELGIFI